MPSQGPAAKILGMSNRATASQSVLPKRSRERSPVPSQPSRSELAPRPADLFGSRSPANASFTRAEDRILPETHFSPTPKKVLEYQEEDDENGFSQDEEVRLVVGSVSVKTGEPSKAPTRRLLQTTLTNVIRRDNIARDDLGQEELVMEPPSIPATATQSSRTRLRSRLAGFASQGTVVNLDGSASESDVEGVMEGTDRQSTPSIEHQDNSPWQLEEEIESPAPAVRTKDSRKAAKEIDLDESVDSDIVMATQEEEIEPEDDKSTHVINNNQYILQGRDEDIVYLTDSATLVPEQPPQVEYRDEILKAGPQGQIVVRCDIGRIRSRAKKRRALDADRTSEKIKLGENDILPEAGIANTDSAQVDRVLSRVIQKQDFAEMQILGQYNLAFIIARRRKLEEDGQLIDDIFIIGVFGIPRPFACISGD